MRQSTINRKLYLRRDSKTDVFTLVEKELLTNTVQNEAKYKIFSTEIKLLLHFF